MKDYLFQIYLPLKQQDGVSVSDNNFSAVEMELSNKFGGCTAFTRAPANGLWKAGDRQVVRDDIVVFEVMAEGLDRLWWQSYRKKLKIIFAQEEVIIFAQNINMV